MWDFVRGRILPPIVTALYCLLSLLQSTVWRSGPEVHEVNSSVDKDGTVKHKTPLEDGGTVERKKGGQGKGILAMWLRDLPWCLSKLASWSSFSPGLRREGRALLIAEAMIVGLRGQIDWDYSRKSVSRALDRGARERESFEPEPSRSRWRF